jgi:cellulose synthase/poly-beta-1,6-N-acetylglucosamine synthase-like glycosyltransferase
MTAALRTALEWFDWFVLGYFMALNTWYLLLVGLATIESLRHVKRMSFAGLDDLFASSLTPPVSIVVPAFNEESGIAECVRGLLRLRYPTLEVVVVDDGSTDGTFDALREAFALAEVPKVIPGTIPTLGAVRSAHVAADGAPLLVLRKDNGGTKADAANTGINVARYPLVCVIDADTVLDRDALLHVVEPFVTDPDRVVAVGGSVRVANGCRVLAGEVVDAQMPRSWLARIQVVEYLRSFLLGRVGWSRLRGLMIISGAFGLFRRDVVMALGGYDPRSIGEDAELVARIHHEMRRARRPYRLVFVGEPVCWTEVPESLSGLRSQRRRWSLGLAQTLWAHRAMILNPRYGRVGLLVVPYFLVFELLTPIVEVVGLGAVALSLALGIVDAEFAAVFFVVAVAYGVFLSAAALAVEEFSYRRYWRWRDFGLGFAAAVVENLGLRQLVAWWRLEGLAQAFVGRAGRWDPLEKRGFGAVDTSAPDAGRPRSA